MSKTAAELMAELKKSQEYKDTIGERNNKTSRFEDILKVDERELVSKINALGFSIQTIWNFVNSENNYDKTVPILIKELGVKHHPRVMSGIVRALALPKLKEDNELWQKLLSMYRETPSDLKVEEPEMRGLKESIASTLTVLFTPERTSEVSQLVSEHPDGDGILWLQEIL